MTDFKPDTLESLIIYLAYIKSFLRVSKSNFIQTLQLGVLDDAELALMDSLLLGFERLDKEFADTIEHCVARSDKADHILLALNKILKGTNGNIQ